MIDWRLRGPEITNCNCAWGCPCQFNSLPTNGDCRAVVAMRIDEGHFGDVDLSGLSWGGMFAWPKAIHEGHGEAFVVIDSKASEAQRQALLTILAGEETEPGATIFNVFASTLETMHEPVFTEIELDLDMDRRTGRIRIEGIVDTTIEPIRNPITGHEHRAKVVLPEGFEYREAEYASGSTRATGPVKLDWQGTHAHLTNIDMTGAGVV
jgi:hypothetical protein